MGESRNARCSRCESPVSLPYWMRTPITVRITIPPMPGRATTASAHSEAISRSSSKTTFGKSDSAPIGKAPLGACGASADTRPSKITSSGATLVALPATGTPETSAKGGTSGTGDAPDPPAAAASPGRLMPPDPSSTGVTPATPNKKEERSDGGCVSGTTAPTTEVGKYCPGAMTSNTGVSTLVSGATTSVTGATPAMPNKKEERSDGGCVSPTTAPATVGMYCPGAMTSDTGATTSVTGATTSVAGATALVTDATTFGTAATGLGCAGTRPACSWSSVSVPPACALGLVGPVEGCWPGCAAEPSVLVGPVEGCWPGCAAEPSVPVGPVEGCWPGCAAEPGVP